METRSQSSERRAAAKRRCSVCGAPAVAYIAYARRALCEKHFQEFIEAKVRRVLEKTGALRRGARILAAVSGGKDSAAMLRALARVAAPAGVEIIGFHIVLGFGPYSERSREAAERACRELGVPCITVSVEEIVGAPVHVLAAKTRRPTCSACGIVKRYIINAAAVELGADYVAMGHNGDDIIAYSVKEFINQNLEALAKLGPSTETIKGLVVGRLRPLYEVYEKEALLYAVVSGTPFLHDECPYRPRAPVEQRIKEAMNRIEEEHPGTKIGFLRRLEKRLSLYKSLAGPEKPRACRICGMPAAGEECSFCRLTRRALGEPKGPAVRAALKRIAAEVIAAAGRKGA